MDFKTKTLSQPREDRKNTILMGELVLFSYREVISEEQFLCTN